MDASRFFVKVTNILWIACVTLALLGGPSWSAARPQSQQFNLHGIVRDSQGKPVPDVDVDVRSGEQAPLTAVTDDKGAYRLSLPAGTYIVEATKQGYVQTKTGPVSVGSDNPNNVDLTLSPLSASTQFYDQPQFTVSGVTDTTNLGGHGSDTVVRTRDALANETAGLARSASAAHDPTSAERSLREATKQNPNDLEANRRLAEFLLQNGKSGEALPYLERAVRLKPDDFASQFDLALADANTGKNEDARQLAESLLQHHDTAELHHLLADVDEKLGNPLEAVRHYQRAAELQPSEPYLFDWGAELLLHHAPEPALDVFTRANKLFPQSARMLIGVGASSFALGNYDRAIENVCRASDLAPSDSVAYLFLGKMDRVPSITSETLSDRLRRFAKLHPENAEANYYYAVALWKRRKLSRDQDVFAQIESLLNTAIRMDPKFAPAYLQLGILQSEQRDFSAAIREYRQAIQFDSQGPEAHYRLAQAYRQMGEPEKAKTEIEIYDRLSKESAEKAERDRHEIRQFVYTLRDQHGAQPQQ